MAREVAGEVARGAVQGPGGRPAARGPRGQINETFAPSLGASSRFADVIDITRLF